MAATGPTQVTLPPGIYTIQVNNNTGAALTTPADNGKPLTLETYAATNTDQQFIVNASGLIIASFNRNSLAYSQIPSLLREHVKRSTTGVGWLINVEPVSDTDPTKRGWKGYILSPDENKYYWTPDAVRNETRVALRREEYKLWFFKTVPNPTA